MVFVYLVSFDQANSEHSQVSMVWRLWEKLLVIEKEIDYRSGCDQANSEHSRFGMSVDAEWQGDSLWLHTVEGSWEKSSNSWLGIGCISFALIYDITTCIVFMLTYSLIIRASNYVFTQKELYLKQRWWLELLKDYVMSILHNPGKANVVYDDINMLSIGSITHVEEEKRELAKEMHILTHLGVRLMDSTKEGIVVTNGDESSLV